MESVEAACVKLDSAAANYVGMVVPTMFFGAPNFGEDPVHDERGTYPVLVLDRPLRFCDTLQWAEERDPHVVHRMQMIFHKQPFGANWNGKHVSVRGTLFEAQTAHHHTPVMLDTIEVTLVGHSQ
jgi:hypothetical protein